jgi:hypothetical protein
MPSKFPSRSDRGRAEALVAPSAAAAASAILARTELVRELYLTRDLGDAVAGLYAFGVDEAEILRRAQQALAFERELAL